MWVTKAREAGHRGKPSALSHQHSSKGRCRGSQLTPGIIFGLMQSFFLPEFAHYVGDRAMLAVHGVVQGAHVLIGNLSRQWGQGVAQLGMAGQRLLAHDGYGVVGREVALVVLEHSQIEHRNEAVGGVAGGQVNLLIHQGAVEQAQVHNQRRPGEAEAVGRHQALVAVRALHKFVAEPGAPLRRVLRRLRNGGQMQAARVRPTNFDGKCVIEAKRRQNRKMELLLVLLFHFFIHGVGILQRRLLENGGQRRARVLRVHVNPPRQHGLLADIGSGEIEAALDFEVSPGFDLLRNQFAQDELLREVLGADYHHVLSRWTAAHQDEGERKCGSENAVHAGRRRFSSNPRPKSASRARRAAGTAPARMTTLFTMARPRKMNSPRPPAPMAAAMVAKPTDITVATRTPAIITLNASGSSTWNSNCLPVIPMPRPASTTARSTPMMPTYVLRMTGSSAYRTSARTAMRSARAPIHGAGSRNPNSARLGIVWITLATPSTGFSMTWRRVSHTPTGTPMATAMAMEMPTIQRCSSVSCQTSARFCAKNCQRLMLLLGSCYQPETRQRRPRPAALWRAETLPACRLPAGARIRAGRRANPAAKPRAGRG